MTDRADILARLDHQYIWHPFTQMKDWLQQEPIVIVRGHGATVQDARGRIYFDANSSIWTNLHGHNHEKINAAIKRQLSKIAHSSALGLANEPASILAEQLVIVTNGGVADPGAHPGFAKVFFSDDGSTALEVALKLAYEYARRTGHSRKPRFLSLQGAYHGDTVGAVSLGHIDLFHKAYGGLLFESDAVPAPYCYRCRYNCAKPEPADARSYRQCRWQCVDQVEQQFARQKKKRNPYAAMVVEPLIQGAAGMIAQPSGWLHRIAEIARGYGAQIIADEVMTGFGRTGSIFACHQEDVSPDFMAVAKGMTGGYLPMAATLTTQAVFDAFLGDYSEFKTFFHGHSFTANQLGSAAALASMDLLFKRKAIQARSQLERAMAKSLENLWSSRFVGDIRQVGLIAGIELVKDRRTRAAFDLSEQVGIRVCREMAKRSVLTRPVGNVIVLMPPYCTTPMQLDWVVQVIKQSIIQVCR